MKDDKTTLMALVGPGILTGVQIEDKYETPDHYTVCRFTLNGVTYQIKEDPDDGYRSRIDTIEVTDDPPMDQYSIPVECSMKPDDEYERHCTLLIKHGDKIILEIGEDDTDDYYPSFVCNYTAPSEDWEAEPGEELA
jgi:hypothetical protein